MTAMLPSWAHGRQWQERHGSQGFSQVRSASMERIAVLILDSVVAFDLAIAAEIFGHADERERYEVAVCGQRAGRVATSTGFDIVAPHGLGAVRRADTIIVPGFEHTERPVPPAVV